MGINKIGKDSLTYGSDVVLHDGGGKLLIYRAQTTHQFRPAPQTQSHSSSSCSAATSDGPADPVTCAASPDSGGCRGRHVRRRRLPRGGSGGCRR